MSNRFHNPRAQFFNSTPAVYSGGKLNFYASGTSTRLDTYSNAALSTPNTNPVVLNSAGRPDVDIFLSDAAYKVVLTDSSDNVIWTVDPYSTSDYTATAQFQVYAGNPNGNVAGTAGSGSIPSDAVWDTTNNILYICTTTGVAAAAVWTAVNASAAVQAVPHPQGRLTPTSATPVIASDVSAGSTLYYTPFIGNLVPIYNGTSTTPTTFSELSLSLVAQHAANTIYDAFVFSNSGVMTLATGPAWSNSGAGTGSRGTGAGTTQLTRLNGFWVNAVSMTGRNGATTYTIAANRGLYVGSILIDGSNGQITCHVSSGVSRKFAVWNAYNRSRITLMVTDPNTSHDYNTATWRASNNSAANSLQTFCGLAEESIEVNHLEHLAQINSTGSILQSYIGIGVNVTNATSGKVGTVTNANVTSSTDAHAHHVIVPGIGLNTVTALEFADATVGLTTRYYGLTLQRLSAVWLG